MSSLLLALFGGGTGVAAGSYTVNVGSLSPGYNFTYYGFWSPYPAIGSVSPSVFAGSSTNITVLATTFLSNNVTTLNNLYFTISGSRPQNLFNTITVGGQTYNSSSASYSTGASTSWSWAVVGSDPFISHVGSNVVVTFA
jgi:hypothetical protein